MIDTPTLEPVAAYALWAEQYPPHAHNPLMLAEERALLGRLPPDLGAARMLDAGCGSGRYLLHARQRGAHQLVGVDLSAEMLARARGRGVGDRGARLGDRVPDSGRASNMLESATPGPRPLTPDPWLIRASLDAIPLRDAWADITICGLTLGHLPELHAPLAELRRVTRPGGTLLCSDFHPIGRELGWRREFSAAGQRYAVRHAWHSIDDWRCAAEQLKLENVAILEPRLDPADIPAGASFDPAALEVPVALVFELRVMS
jgi:malonyl-CoA O-methyltransferase